MTATVTETGPDRRQWRAPAAVLAVGTFVVGTDAFVMAGVLPSISRDLDVSIAMAGQLITAFAIAYAVLSPVLAALTASWARRTVLVTALVVFAVGNAVTALAPGYAWIMVSRVVAAAGAAMFTPNAGATAAALAGETHRGRAIAVVNVGLTSSLVLGAPLGTFIGGTLGWRATMWFVTVLPALIVPLIAWRLPAVRLDGPATGLRGRLAPMADRRVAVVMTTTVIAFIGIYIPYTYISAVWAPAVHGEESRLSVLMLVFGVTATFGNLAAGRFADHYGARRVVKAAMVACTVVFAAITLARGSFIAAVPVVAAAGWVSFSVLTPQQHRCIAVAPAGAQPLVVSLNAAAVYLAISLSSVVGALGIRAVGATHLPFLACAFTVVAGVFTWLTGRRDQLPAAATTPEPAGAAAAPASPRS